MASAGRLLEADKLMESAKKHASKGFFKKPNWEEAAADYQKATNIYINCGAVDKAKDAARQAADAHVKNEALFFGASVLDQTGNFLRDRNLEGDACSFFVEASKLFAKDNKPQQQADALAKASRCVSVEKTDEAVGWLNESLRTLEENDRWHMVKEPYKNLVLILVRANRYVDAIAVEKRFMYAMSKGDNADLAAKCGLEIIVLCLALGDEVLADREFQDLTANGFGFTHSKEQRVAYDLVQACINRDAIALAEAVKDQILTFLLADISRIAKKLKIPGGSAPAKKQTLDSLTSGSAAPPPAGAAAVDDEENTC